MNECEQALITSNKENNVIINKHCVQVELDLGSTKTILSLVTATKVFQIIAVIVVLSSFNSL